MNEDRTETETSQTMGRRADIYVPLTLAVRLHWTSYSLLRQMTPLHFRTPQVVFRTCRKLCSFACPFNQTTRSGIRWQCCEERSVGACDVIVNVSLFASQKLRSPFGRVLPVISERACGSRSRRVRRECVQLSEYLVPRSTPSFLLVVAPSGQGIWASTWCKQGALSLTAMS